jgi:hypothetical protein
MTLRKTIEVVTRLAANGVVHNYAIAGAVAALNYIQPMLTEDLDILISVDGFEKRASGLLLLGPIEKALAGMGLYRANRCRIQTRGLACAISARVISSGRRGLGASCRC